MFTPNIFFILCYFLFLPKPNPEIRYTFSINIHSCYTYDGDFLCEENRDDHLSPCLSSVLAHTRQPNLILNYSLMLKIFIEKLATKNQKLHFLPFFID